MGAGVLWFCAEGVDPWHRSRDFVKEEVREELEQVDRFGQCVES